MLVGRDRELAQLATALTRIVDGGALYLFTGEPGIGKTRLATEVAGIARAKGLRTSWGRCWEAGGAPPFWPWHEALEGLGLAFPDAATPPAVDPNEARFGLFRSVAAVLATASAREPLLLVFEDLHAADHPTLVLLEYVVGQLRDQPVVLVGTYRDVEARLRPDSGDVLARLERSGKTLRLAALSEAEVAALVGEVVGQSDARLAETVYDITRGNPLFVEEMVRDVRGRGAVDPSSIPLGVREIIRQRLGRMPEEVRDLLDAAAVLGVEVAVPVLARVRREIHAVLDDAIRSGLVIARDDRLRFAHSLYREGLYHELGRLRRQALHRDAARALADSGAPPDQIAHHLFESGPDNAREAIHYAISAAAQAVEIFAFEEATALLDRASAALPSGPLEGELRCRVLIAQGEARVRGGDATGREQCAKAAGIAREIDDPSLLAHAGLAYGAVFFTGGVDPFLVGVLEEALARMSDTETPLRARVMARLAAARQPSVPEARQRDIDLAQEAVAMARRVADRRELLAVLHAASGVLYGAADPSVRLPITLEQERLAEELGDVARLLNARVRIAIDHLELADFASYEALVASYDTLAHRIGPAAEGWRVPLMRSMLALRHDCFDDSLRWQRESRRIDAERPRARRAQAFHRICYLRAAERHSELRASIPELRNLWLSMPYGVALAEARVGSTLARLGAEEEVRELLGGLPEATFVEEINLVPLGEAIWCARDERYARRLYELGLPYQTRWNMYWFDCEIVEAPCTRVLAYLAGVLGEWQACDRFFERALLSVEAVGRRSMAARMRFELGDLLVRSEREPERARSLLVDARQLASEVGLTDLVALIERRHPGVVPLRKELAQPSSSPAPVEFSMVAEGEYFAIATRRGTLRFKATVGMQYLARLVERPDVAVHVLELAGSMDYPDRGDAGVLADGDAVRAYRGRLEALREVLEEAQTRGDVDGAERARDEMEAIARHISGATGRGGRGRRAESAIDRARSAVQRRIKDALQRIGAQDAELGAWLGRAVRTGNYCSFRLRG